MQPLNRKLFTQADSEDSLLEGALFLGPYTVREHKIIKFIGQYSALHLYE